MSQHNISSLDAFASSRSRRSTAPRSGPSRSGPSRRTSRRTSRPGTSRPATSRLGTSRPGTGNQSRRRSVRTARDQDEVVVCLIENNFAEVGVCAYNLSGFDIELRQISDSKTFSHVSTMLAVLNVVEIIMSYSSANGPLDTTLNAHSLLRDIKRTFIPRAYFNETQGPIAVERFSVERCPYLKNLTSSPYYLALASCGALLRFIEDANNLNIAPASLRIRFKPNEGTLFIDMQTIEGLELLQNGKMSDQSRTERKKGSLLHVMDKTHTRPGRRLLRRSLLEPHSNMDMIAVRHDAVSELVKNEELYFNIVNILKKFPDLERAIAVLIRAKGNSDRAATQLNAPASRAQADSSTGSRSATPHRNVNQNISFINDTRAPTMNIIKNILIVKKALNDSVDLYHALQHVECQLLVGALRVIKLPILGRLRDIIDDVIKEDAGPSRQLETMQLQGAFAVKDGRNGQLDVTRKVLCEIISRMREIAEDIKDRYQFVKLELTMNASRGYHLVLRNFESNRAFPKEFVQVQKSGKTHKFTTTELDEYNTKYLDALNEIWLLTNVEVGEVLDTVFQPENALAMYFLCDAVGLMDLVTSFVTYASLSDVPLCRPKLIPDGPAVVLRGAHHPIIADLSFSVSVSNDILLDEVDALHIISGQNNSGKSTLLKMVGLLTIIAHAGCNVTAEKASFMISDCILSRFTTVDCEDHSHSHFSAEMSDVAVILETVNSNMNLTRRRIQDAEKSRSATSSWREAIVPTRQFKKCIVLLDELGRSTSTLDGFAVAFSTLEELLMTPGVYTMAATHFLGLGALEVYPNVTAVHMVVEKESNQAASSSAAAVSSSTPGVLENVQANKIKNRNAFTYKVSEGILSGSAYGVEMARAAGFPRDVIELAMELRNAVPTRRIGDSNVFSDQVSEETKMRSRAVRQRLYALRRMSQVIMKSRSSRQLHKELLRFQSMLCNALNPTRSNTGSPTNRADDVSHE